MHLDIQSSWFLAALCLVTVALAVGTVVLLRRRLRWQGWSICALTVALVVVTLGAFVNDHYGFYRYLDDVVSDQIWPDGSGHGPHPWGGVVTTTIPGTASGMGALNAMVYLPPQYSTEPHRSFPVIYMIHGTPGGPDDMFRAGRLFEPGYNAAEAHDPVILVAPSAGTQWTSDTECVNGAQGTWETYLSQDVVAAVDRNYRTIRDADARAIGGLSMGGYCALNLGLRHRDTFSTIIDLSGETEPTYEEGMRALFGNVPGLDAVVAANSPETYAPRISTYPPERVWVDCGSDDDPLEREVVDMGDTLRSRGFDVVVRTRPGGHEWGVWRDAMSEAVPWAARAMTASALGNPGPTTADLTPP